VSSPLNGTEPIRGRKQAKAKAIFPFFEERDPIKMRAGIFPISKYIGTQLL